MEIIAEYFLLENLVINYIILYATKRFTRTKTSNLRIILASLIGAFYAFVVFFPSLQFLVKFLAKIAVSILIVIVAFNPIRLHSFIKQITTFYIVTFVFGGAALAFFYFFDIETFFGEGIFYIQGLPSLVKLLFVAIILSLILLKFTWGYIQKIISKEQAFIPITIYLNDRRVDIMALMDTGNSLKDPISETPVIIAEFYAIKELLPNRIQDIFLKYNENNLEIISNVMTNATDEIRFRLIPFKSIGLENGMLLGFKPDKVALKNEDRTIISDIVVGIYNNTLSPDKKYVALLHPEILN